MRFVDHVRAGEYHTIVGYLLFGALMTAGYYDNVTFVQLGLIDLGTRLVGMSHTAVSMWMGALGVGFPVSFSLAIDFVPAPDRGPLAAATYYLANAVPIEWSIGAGLFVVALELLGDVPLLGAVGQALLVAVGFGAVLITYFGLQEFEPAEIPG